MKTRTSAIALTSIVFALTAFCLSGKANAANQVVVGFEDISAQWDLVDGYGGISGWESFGGQLSTGDSNALGSNLMHASSGSLYFDAAPVVFEGLYINYWVSEGIVSPFSLLYQGTVVHSVSIDSQTQPLFDLYWLASGYSGPVDEIRFNYGSSDGFIMDNLTYTAMAPVPEPETWAQLLAGMAVLGMAGMRRRKGRNAG